MNKSTNTLLKIHNYEINLYIGINDEEKINLQKILINIEIQFSKSPKAIISDKISDTICYHTICKKLEKFNNISYNTIEYLGQSILNSIQDMLIPHPFSITVTKFPKIKNLNGNVSFTIKSSI
ncbi:MAG: FolB domain-containing protein [Candidatus Midichloriaceae bacterium]|jgi:FolB domain-containing protein